LYSHNGTTKEFPSAKKRYVEQTTKYRRNNVRGKNNQEKAYTIPVSVSALIPVPIPVSISVVALTLACLKKDSVNFGNGVNLGET
jgi:hypothetical protein